MRDMLQYQKQNSYPHMNIRDKEIWDRFIDKYPDAYKQVQYDYHVGDGPKFNTLDDDETDRNQDMLYRLRIDVIGHSNNSIDIIELKPNAGAGTIGQVTSYKILYERDEDPLLPVNAIIVTDAVNANMVELCKLQGVRLIIV